jgi:hypothetical protein
MSKKTLNTENLSALGAARLADLLMEVSSGSAEIKRRLRLELSHNLGPEELARDVRKRLASIRKSKTFVGWRKRKTLIKDLRTQAEMITDKIAPDAPTEAFDLLWQFLDLAPSVYLRCDDSKGDVGDVFRTALAHVDAIAMRADHEPAQLADRVWDAVRDNTHGQFDGIIGLMAPALGDAGLKALKALVQDHACTPIEDANDHAALQFLRDLRSGSGNFAAEQKDRLIRTALQEIAAAQGDTDAYIAQYAQRDLLRPTTAAEVARLLLDNARPSEAFERLTDANLNGHGHQRGAWDMTYVDCLLALGRLNDAQDHRWACFCDTLNAQMLRDFLKVLPDFDDLEAEEDAKAHAAQFEDTEVALRFFLEWPDLLSAAHLIENRADEIDGLRYHVLAPAAETLRDRHPLAATLLWRALIEHALYDGRTTGYANAADHLMVALLLMIHTLRGCAPAMRTKRHSGRASLRFCS